MERILKCANVNKMKLHREKKKNSDSGKIARKENVC